MNCKLTTAVILSLCCVIGGFVPSTAFALDDVLDGSPVVRRNLQYRSARHEVTGLVGMTLGDPFIRNILPGARYDYHMFDWLSFGGRIQGGIPIETQTYGEVDRKVTANNETFAMEASSIRLIALGHVSVSPLVGKMLAFSRLPIQFDVHFDLLAGMVGVGSTGDQLQTGTGFSLGAAGGIRVFLSDVIAITTDLQAISTTRALSVNRDSREEGYRSRFNTILNFGVAFFMPPKPSRAD
ncbi:MAG: hypothetical protein KC502_06255 [Myxococcales bacterium]|nr:hypothetical protein [Myxococcales bacterium]